MKTVRLYFVNHFIHLLPETKCFGLKRTLLKIAGIKVGWGVRVCSSITIIGDGTLSIGDNTWIGPHCFISCSASNIKIERNVDIAPQVSLITGSHMINKNGDRVAGKGYNMDISVGEGSWLCARSLILGGSVIGRRTIVAAGAVTKGVYNDEKMLYGCLAKEKDYK